MPFIDLLDDEGKRIGTAHINLGRKHVGVCVFCLKLDRLRQLAGKLCDFPLGHGKTCSAPICDKHATKGGKDIDYCPDHKSAAPQKALEFGT